MNQEEQQFPESSGYEIHLNSENGIEMQLRDPRKHLGATSDPNTGGLENQVPGVSESSGTSPFDKLLNNNEAAFKKFTSDFEHQLLFGKQKLTSDKHASSGFFIDEIGKLPDNKSWFDNVMEGNDVKLLRQLMEMPKCMIAEAILDPKIEYKVPVKGDTSDGNKYFENLLGEHLSFDQVDYLIDQFIEEVQKTVGDLPVKDPILEVSEYTKKRIEEMIGLYPGTQGDSFQITLEAKNFPGVGLIGGIDLLNTK